MAENYLSLIDELRQREEGLLRTSLRDCDMPGLFERAADAVEGLVAYADDIEAERDKAEVSLLQLERYLDSLLVSVQRALVRLADSQPILPIEEAAANA